MFEEEDQSAFNLTVFVSLLVKECIYSVLVLRIFPFCSFIIYLYRMFVPHLFRKGMLDCFCFLATRLLNHVYESESEERTVL